MYLLNGALILNYKYMGLGQLHSCGEMKRILEDLYNNDQSGDTWRKENLYATALKFRLLRQHGYNISQGNLKKNIYSSPIHLKWKEYI